MCPTAHTSSCIKLLNSYPCSSKVREGNCGRLDNSGHGILQPSYALLYRFMVSTYAYSIFQLSNAVLLSAKLLLESESLGFLEILYHPESPPLPCPIGSCIKSKLELDWIRKSYRTHTMSGLRHEPWTCDHSPAKFNKSAGGCVGTTTYDSY